MLLVVTWTLVCQVHPTDLYFLQQFPNIRILSYFNWHCCKNSFSVELFLLIAKLTSKCSLCLSHKTLFKSVERKICWLFKAWVMNLSYLTLVEVEALVSKNPHLVTTYRNPQWMMNSKGDKKIMTENILS